MCVKALKGGVRRMASNLLFCFVYEEVYPVEHDIF